jgi:integrase
MRDKDRHFAHLILHNRLAFSQMSASVLDTGVTRKTASKRYPAVTLREHVSTRLTAKTVENIKPSTTRREVPDGEVRGMYLVIQPSGAKSYALRYRHAGKPRKLTIGPAEMGLGEARKLAASARAAIAGGKDPQGEKAVAKEAVREGAVVKRDSVAAIVADFVEKHVRRSNKPSTAKEYERLLAKEIVGPWRGRRLADISRRDVNRLLDDIVERGAPIAANRVLAILRSFCKWAVSREIIEHSPCDGVMARSTETPRDRVLDDRELTLVWRAADTLGWPFSAIVRLLLLTGQRRGEVVGLRWDEIDFEKQLWLLPGARTKNRRSHVLPLSSAAIEILSALPRIENGGGLVFPAGFVRRTTHGQGPVPISGFSVPKRRLDRAIAELAEEDSVPLAQWGFHDLRRSCASGMARLGVELHVIERCLNHVSGSFGGIVAVYQKHRFEDGMRRAMDIWAGHVATFVSGDAASNVVELGRAR